MLLSTGIRQILPSNMVVIGQLEMFLDEIKIPLMISLIIVESIAIIYAIRVIRLHKKEKESMVKCRLCWRLGKNLSEFVVSGDGEFATKANENVQMLEINDFLSMNDLFIAKTLDERHKAYLPLNERIQKVLQAKLGINYSEWFNLGNSMVAIGGLVVQYLERRDPSDIESLKPVLNEFEDVVDSLKLNLSSINKMRKLISDGGYGVDLAGKLFSIIPEMNDEIQNYFYEGEI